MKSIRVFALTVLAVLLVVGSAGAVKVSLFYANDSNQTIEFYTKAVEMFEAKHPDIEVELVGSGTGGGHDFIEKLSVLRASGLTPDLFEAQADKLGYILRGWAMDITPYFERDKHEINADDFLPGMVETFSAKNRLYGLPTSVTGQGIFYNVDMFAESGLAELPVNWDSPEWTWDQFTNYSRKLVRQNNDGTLARAAVAGFNEAKLPDISWIFGGDWFSEEAYANKYATRSTLDRPENIQGWEAVQEAYKSGWVGDAPDTGIDTWGGFWNGTIAMDWIGWWKLKFLRDADPGFTYSLGPMPKVVTRNHTLWTGTIYISKETSEPEAAWKLLQFMTGTEVDRLRTQYIGGVPARRSALSAYVDQMARDTALDAEQMQQWLTGAVSHGRPALEQSIYGAPEVEARMMDWLPPMLRGEKDVRNTIAEIQPIVDEIVAKYADELKNAK